MLNIYNFIIAGLIKCGVLLKIIIRSVLVKIHNKCNYLLNCLLKALALLTIPWRFTDNLFRFCFFLISIRSLTNKRQRTIFCRTAMYFFVASFPLLSCWGWACSPLSSFRPTQVFVGYIETVLKQLNKSCYLTTSLFICWSAPV